MSARITGISLSGNTATTSVALPTHNPGDLILLFVSRSTNATVPTKPSAAGTVPAWVDLDVAGGTQLSTTRVQYFVATANNHTSGAWTNGQFLAAIVIAGAPQSSPIGGHAKASDSSSSTSTAPAVTLSKTDGSSLLLHYHFHRGAVAANWASPPAGYTQLAAQDGICIDQKNSSTSDGAETRSVSASATGMDCATVEILSAPGGFFAMF
jgi:hypothetical protein